MKKSTDLAKSITSTTTSRKRASTALLPKPSESEIQKACLDWLNTIPGVKVWRQNTGAVVSEYKGKKRFMRFGQKGQADITGLTNSGVRIEIEIKRGGEKPTDAQLDWLRTMWSYGAITFWTDSIERCVEQTRDAFIFRGWQWNKNWEL